MQKFNRIMSPADGFLHFTNGSRLQLVAGGQKKQFEMG